MTKMTKLWGALALVALLFCGSAWAELTTDFLYTGNGNGSTTGWITSWDGEGFADARRAIGPGNMGLVYAAEHVDDSNKWHPYKGYQVPETFSIAFYTDLSAVCNLDTETAVLFAAGRNSGDRAILYKRGNKVGVATNSGDVETDVPAGGYHLYTFTYTSDKITLTIDNGTPVEKTGTFARPATGFQIAGIYGGVGSWCNPSGLPVAAVAGFAKVLTADDMTELTTTYPATTESSYSNGSYNTNGGKLFAGTITQNGFIEIKRGTLIVPAGAHYQVKAIGFGDAQGETQGFGIELDGEMTITGTCTKTGNGGAGIKAGVEGNEGGFLGGEWEGVGTYNIRGTLSIPNSYMQLVYDANKQTYNIENGGKLIVKGIQANKGGGNKARSTHEVNVKNGGLLQVKTALSLGTINANIEEGGTLELTDTFDHMLNNSNLGGITGSGKLKLTGTNWVMLPNDETKAANLAAIAEIENNISGTNGQLLMPNAKTYTIGSLSGTGGVRADYTDSAARTLKIVQSKDTTWSGAVKDDSNAARIINFEVDSANGSTLTMSGTYTGNDVRTGVLTVDEGGAVKLTKVWPTAGFNVNGTLTIDHGVWQPVYMVKGTGTINWAGTNTFSVNAADGDDALILDGTTINQTAGTLSLRAPGNRTSDAAQDAIGYIKNATITSSSTLSCSGKIGVKGACSITKTAGTCSISTIELSEAGATLVLNGVAMTVTSGVEGMAVREDTAGGVKTYSLYSVVAKVGENCFETLEDAINAALGRPITLLANATGPAGCYLINANGHTFSVGTGLSEVHWTRTDGVMYKVTTTADATVGQKRVESNKYDKVTAFSGANPVVVNSLFIPATAAMPKGSKVAIQSIGLSYRETGCPNSITLAGTTSSSMANTGSDTIRVGENNGSVKWVRYAFDDVEVTVGEEIAITDGSFNAQFTSVAETDATALRKTSFKDSQSLIYEIQYTVTKIASPNVVTVTINGETTGYATIDEAIEAAAAAEGAVITLADATADAPAGFVKGENGVLTAAKYIVISPSSYVENWKTYVAARAESPVADGITFGVKNADEIYAAYPANASAEDGTPRNDAESIHKYIGMMQKLGTKYFVLGGRFKDAWEMTTADRATMIPGVYVYPKRTKATTVAMNNIASDLYYACHYVAEGTKYTWDPNGDKVYVGLRETTPDSMEDVRHFQPNCVVSRMEFLPRAGETYADCIANYTAKLKKGEAEDFAGNDKYVAWTSYCVGHSADGRPDVYAVMQERLNAMTAARAAKEATHLVYLQNITADQVKENTDYLYASDWEIFLPFGHGIPESFAGLNGADFADATKIIKFFMANVPCLTGQLETYGGCAAELALTNPNGGSLVSINNTSFGYASPSGINQRHLGVSDELVDWCLDRYLAGNTAGEAWRYAIATYTDCILSNDGFKPNALEDRDHAGSDKDGTPHKVYVFAAFLEQELFGDPLVKIQTAKGASNLGVTVERAASIRSLPAMSFDAALTEFAKNDAKAMSVMKSCGNAETAITVPSGKTLAVDNATLTASTITVNGTFVGAGTVNANFVFGADATLDTSRLTKLTIGSGAITSYPQGGINFIVPEGTTQIPAVLSLLVANSPSETAFHAAVKSITAKGSESALTPCGTAFKLEALNGKIYLVDEGNMIEVPHFLTDLGATVATITIEDKEGNKRELELARDEHHQPLGYYLVPAGSKIVITITPDAEHSGDNQTAEINSAADLKTITDELTAYENPRAAATVFYNAGAHVEYTGAMAGCVVNSEGHDSQILDGDTVVFDRNHAVPADIVVGADPKGAKLVFEKDVTLTTEQPTTLFTGKAFEIHADHVLTFMPGTTEGFKLGNCTMDKGMAAFAAGGQNNENNIFYLDSIVGTTLLDFRPEVEIRSLNSDNWIHFHTRVTGGATVTGNVRILGDARVIVKRSEYITVTGDVTAQVVDAEGNPVEGEYHRLTIDAMDAMVEWWDDNGTPRLKPVNLLKLKNKATADAIVGRINLIAPEVKDENGELILWQLDTLDDGMIVMKRLEYVVRDGFFMNGILGKDEYADWKYNSAFDQSVTKIQATCPAELKFDFTGAAEGAVITVDKPIELSGTGKLTFDVPEGKTVVVTGTISGTEGVRKSGKGTLIFAGTADNTFEGSLVVSEGAVRTTKAHGYSMHRTLHDGTVENPEIDVHTGATLDLGNVCDLDNLTIISAGTITNSVHDATRIGKIKTLTLKGDTTVCGHTFGMAKDSKIVLEGHKLTIAMERGECVTTPKPDGTGTEVHDHEFELNNTQVSGGKDNLATPDIVVIQGTLSCEGSTYAGRVFTKGVNNLGNASLKICEDAAIRLDTDLIVKRIQIVDAMKKVVVPCNVNPDGTPAAPHTHEFEKIWEESVGGGHYGKIIIRQELVGGIKAPRLQLGLDSDTSKMLYDVGNDMNSPEIRRIRLNDGEYIDCTEEFIFGIGYPFNAFFEDWTGEAGTRRLFHGWSKFADGYSSAEIINPWAVKFTSQDHSKYELTVCDWYPYGSYGFRDVPCACVNTLPLEDQDWAYVLALWPVGDKPFEFANVLMTTITHMDANSIYKWNDKTQKFDLDTDVLKTNNVLCPVCQRGDGSMDFVIAEDWLKQYMGEDYSSYMYEYLWSEAGGNGTISKWINEKGANGIERWQSYMLGLDPTRADSLPVLAVRNDVPPSVQKDGKTFVNVKVGGIAPRGYQYISPIYQVEEVCINPKTGEITAGTKTDWQADPNFEVEVPVKSQAKDATSDHVKYFRVNVSFEGSDGMNNK